MPRWFARQLGGPWFASDPDGTVTIPWHAPIVPLLVTFVGFTAWDALWQLEPTTPALLSGYFCIMSMAGIRRRSTVRHWIALVAGGLAVLFLPEIARHALTGTQRHNWYLAHLVPLAGAVVAVYGYVALTRLPGFAPPAPVTRTDQDRMTPPTRWTPDERAVLLGGSDRVIIRRVYPIVVNGLSFGVLAVVSAGVALGAWANDAWAVGMITMVLCLFFGRTAVRAGRLQVSAGADGIVVRNLQWTHRVAWAEVLRVVPPSADEYRYLRIERVHRGPIRCTALARSVFQRRHILDNRAIELAALLGPDSPCQPARATR